MKNQLQFCHLVKTPATIVLVLTGLLLVLAVPAASQTTEVPGSAAANKAYQELSLKRYEAAISEFQKALALNPSNSDWRTDLAYTELAADASRDAAGEFATVYRYHPDQFKIALELGHVYQQLHDNATAEKYFAAAGSSVDPKISRPARLALNNLSVSELKVRKQKAYDLLERGHRKEALSLFQQIHSADPSESATTLRPGHLYQDTGKLAKAREMFKAERYNQDPQVSAQASAARNEVSRRSAWWFAPAHVSRGLFRELRHLFRWVSKLHSGTKDKSLPSDAQGHQPDEPTRAPGSALTSKPHSGTKDKSLPSDAQGRQPDEPTRVSGSALASKPHSGTKDKSLPSDAQGRQPDEPTGVPGSTAANEAYQELSLKHYEAAIREFREALASNPTNADWRTDLAYTELAAGSSRDAAREFETVYRDHPEQLKIALELGYVYLQLNDSAAAEKYFTAAGSSVEPEISRPAQLALNNLRDSELEARKQKAYDLLEQGHRKEALSLFQQIHLADPGDSAITLQLGYLYQDTGKLAKAREMFEAERLNQDRQVSAQATAALKEVNHQSAWWFASAYVAPFYESRFANQINPIEFKVGLRATRYLQPYVGMRFTRDIRSTSGTLPVIYSDNSDVFSVGLQSPILGHGTSLYAEAGTAVSLMSQPVQGRAVPDYRAGITWYKPWETSLAEAAKKRSRNFSLTGNAYSDISFYSRYNDNVIGYLQIRQGVNLPTAHLLPMQALAVINVVKDSNGEFYNNVVEAGPALRIAPFRRLLDLQFEVDYLRGVYTVHDPTNPYGSSYGDARIFLIWSKDF